MSSSPSFSLGPGLGSGLGPILLVPMIAQLQAVLTSKNVIRYKTEPPTPLPAAEPPLQSVATTAAIAHYTAEYNDFVANAAVWNAATKKAAQDTLKMLSEGVSLLRASDKLALDTYARVENQLNIYRDTCDEFSVSLGELGPTGTLKDKIFGGEKKTLGPDPTIHVLIHELFTALEGLKELHKMEYSEALEILHKITSSFPKENFNKESGTEFQNYGQQLLQFYGLLTASTPAPAAGAAATPPFISVTVLYSLLLEWIQQGPHGIHVRKLISAPALAAPAETHDGFHVWLQSARRVVDDEAKKSTESKRKLAAFTSSDASKKEQRKDSAPQRPARIPPPTGQELNKLYKGYHLPADGAAKAKCLCPHNTESAHQAHECFVAARVVQDEKFVNTDIDADVLAKLKAVQLKSK